MAERLKKAKEQAVEGVLGPGHGQQLLHASSIYQQFCKPA